MALGDSGKGKSNKLFENTYYSRVRFKNHDEKLALGFSFRSGMLVIDISKEKEGFAYETVANIHVTPTKAKILLAQIDTLKESIASGKINPTAGYGINSGLGEIVSILALHATADGRIGVTIGKVDNTGNYTASVDYVFSKDYNYGLTWKNIEKMDVEKSFANDVEFEQFCDVISQFSIQSTGAGGYFNADIARYDTRAVLNKMNPIYDKLGIERNYSGRSGGQRNTFFDGNGSSNNNGSGTSNNKSYDEAMDDLEFEN